MEKIKAFVKKEIVLCVAFVLAVISMFIVTPQKEYVEYIDFRTLTLLFCLMTVVAGWKSTGVFDFLATLLLSKTKSVRGVVALLVFICFFSSMFITNDVALITFVPFAVLMLARAGRKDLIIYTVALQTVAANLGSLLLPVGNPQNLYLYGLTGESFGGFVLMMLPLWIMSFIIVLAAVLLVKNGPMIGGKGAGNGQIADNQHIADMRMKLTIVYLILFAFCLCTVMGFLQYYVLLAIVAATVFVIDRKRFANVDYMLLLTFVCFFVFIGNVKQIPQLSQALEGIIAGNELNVGIITSQVISNVPAAILLSGFSANLRNLLWGVDIGGLGTLIASLASLISYKIYAASEKSESGKYMMVFTLMNVACLGILWVFAIIVL